MDNQINLESYKSQVIWVWQTEFNKKSHTLKLSKLTTTNYEAQEKRGTGSDNQQQQPTQAD